MIEVEDLPELVDPVIIAAFEGWNDAGEAATSVVEHLALLWDAQPIAAIDPEEYYDFQVNRPRVGAIDGVRRITWPTTRVLHAPKAVAGRDVLLIQGIEPSMRWRSFVVEFIALADEVDASMMLCLGALLADVPHTRPLPVGVYTNDPAVERKYLMDSNDYTGPTGMIGVASQLMLHERIPAASLWVSVPHYVSTPPNPKAQHALLSVLRQKCGQFIQAAGKASRTLVFCAKARGDAPVFQQWNGGNDARWHCRQKKT